MVTGVLSSILFLLVVVDGVLSFTLMFASCGSWGVYCTNIFVNCSWMYFLKVYLVALAAGISST